MTARHTGHYIVWDGEDWEVCETLQEVVTTLEGWLGIVDDVSAYIQDNVAVYELGKRVRVKVTPPREMKIEVG